MTDFLFFAACFVMAMVALGLIGIAARGPGVDLILAVQLIGSGGTAILLLLGVATAGAAGHRRRADAGPARRIRGSCVRREHARRRGRKGHGRG